MENFKLSSYGFLHFESIEDRDVFFNEYQGKKFLVNDENNVTLNFLPVKRSDSYNNRSVISVIIYIYIFLRKYLSISNYLLTFI